MTKKVLVTERLAEAGLAVLRDKGCEVDVKLKMTPEELIETVPGYDALIVRSATKVTAEVVEAADRLRIIGRAGVGVDNVDVEAATEHGIIVCNAPTSNIVSAAEHAIGLMLACARKVPQANASMHEGVWERGKYTGVELYEKTLAIFGLGRIGGLVAERARAFGMKLIGYDPYCSPERAEQLGVTLIVPLYVEGLCGGTALEAGVVLLPGTVAALVLNPLAGVLTDKVGVRPVALVSGAFLATGAVLMSFLDADTPLYVTTLCQAVRAVGVSGLVGPLTSWSLAQLPRPIVADGSSFCISARQACASLGTSVMVFLIAVAGASAAGLANPALAYQLAFGFSAVMAVATLGFIVAKVR